MHWSGKVKIVAILVAVILSSILRFGLGVSWYAYVPLGLLAFLALPLLYGLWLGLGDRRRWAREVRQREHAMRSELGRELTPAEKIQAIRPLPEPPPAATVELARRPDGSTN